MVSLDSIGIETDMGGGEGGVEGAIATLPLKVCSVLPVLYTKTQPWFSHSHVANNNGFIPKSCLEKLKLEVVGGVDYYSVCF